MATRAFEPADAIRASDADREAALADLRPHWLAGRLTLEEYEERCGEAANARYVHELRMALRELPDLRPPRPPATPPALAPAAPPPATLASRAMTSVVLGSLALMGLFVSFGMLFLLTLPASTWAWSLGRRTRLRSSGPIRTLATVGEWFGVIATTAGCLALLACATIATKL